VLFKKANEDKVVPDLEPNRPRLLRTSRSDEAEQRLKTEPNKAA
jgi:uncharacterized membrane protein